ncbi:meteorin-like protein [Uloborus diversus]|uniref:meteorin-like protein n=1 Tax=Uloborus diversus TaxID=327109 RepID=UPI002409E268|nr:meteorin-like protein [Uloborus diversus]
MEQHTGCRPCTVFAGVLLVISYLISKNSVSAAALRISDECDWFGSGIDSSQGNSGVLPIYLRCKEGIIEWQYPRGALRIILRTGHSGKDFTACFKVLAHSSGATLYLEGHQSLRYLYGHGDESNSENEVKCYKSIGGQVALFLEAQMPQDSLKKEKIQFLYDLQPLHEKAYSDCRPCTERELLYLFCTSDFAVRGSISALYQNELMQRTELTVRSSAIIRDSEPKVFTPTEKLYGNNTVYSGVIHRPLHCGTKVGSGEFLFLGRWRLGDPIISCAPRWTEWKKVRRKAVMSETLDCVLD